MSLKAKSSFFYGLLIDDTNYYVEFEDDGAKRTAQLNPQRYSHTNLANELAKQMTDAGMQDYYVAFDRATRKYTISAVENFDLDVEQADSDNYGLSAWATLGFTTSRTGSNEYTADLPAGKEYRPQFYLQSYVPPENYVESVKASVNESGSGNNVEIVSFGKRQYTEFNIVNITNLARAADNIHLDLDTSALANVRDFINYLIDKGPIEFMPDRSNTTSFHTIILGKTPSQAQGTGFKLKEYLSKGLPDVYETGVLKFRVVI